MSALEARFGVRVAARLHQGSQDVPHDIGERLRVARESAVARARHVQRLAAAQSPMVVSHHGGAATLSGGNESWWVRLSALAPLVVLLAGLLFVHEWQHLEQIDATAELDAAILSDDLPPAAYTDPGFVEFLSNPETTATQ
ncbi:MAG: hypothetical protein RL375_4802 [Pseudomonadota bacterium]|jgi:hypothetical protein